MNNKETDYIQERINRWNGIAVQHRSNFFSSTYQKRLRKIYSFLIPPGSDVLELGCGEGDLLASVQPANGVGIDFSQKNIELAKNKYPQLHLLCADVSNLDAVLFDEKFDFIVLSDLINDLWDVQRVFELCLRFCKSNTRLILNSYSRLWHLPLYLAQKIGLAKPVLEQNWFTREDIRNLLHLTGFDSIKGWEEVLFPVPIPLLEPFLNQFLVRFWPFKYCALTNMLVACPSPVGDSEPKSVSVVIPARNEAGNIEKLFQNIPEMGKGTELIFIEGHSQDNTYLRIEEMIAKYPQRKAKLYLQDGIGKGDAVRKGFEKASGEILMIYDADLTVLPEDLPRFYAAIATNKGQFINGVRLVYPREKEAMRFANLIGNKFFGSLFSWIIGQPIKDTLCGTKVLLKKDYEVIHQNRDYFGEFDPFGDFDLLFSAARFGYRILDLPVRYQERTYGTTNIQRWKHGWLLLKMAFFALWRLKFV